MLPLQLRSGGGHSVGENLCATIGCSGGEVCHLMKILPLM
jgi:hypothetical protein